MHIIVIGLCYWVIEVHTLFPSFFSLEDMTIDSIVTVLCYGLPLTLHNPMLVLFTLLI